MSEFVTSCLTFTARRPRAKYRLLCFPFAGGSASVFKNWQKFLPPSIEVVSVEYPGHGMRMGEPLANRWEPLMAMLLPELTTLLDKPLALFGHSMGGVFAFECARAMRAQHNTDALHLFISGARAVHLPFEDQRLYDLPDADLAARLGLLEGTPRELLDNPDILKMILPIMRNDMEVAGNYRYVPQAPLNCKLTALCGETDPIVSMEDAAGWQLQTTQKFVLKYFQGGHFFLNSSFDQVIQQIAESFPH